MDPYRMADDEDGEEEEDWMDTNWDTIQESSSKMDESKKEAEVKLKGGSSSKESAAPLMTRMQLNDHKAGMEGLDKEHINQIIYEVSKGSRFFENERRKEQQVQQRIQEQEKHRRAISEPELQKGLVEADTLVEELKQSRDLSQTIVHVDMDAFYAAVEMRENPSLRNKPMAVGGIGMLSTSNYEARKYGVRAAMPGFIGKKLCPQLLIVPLNFPTYREVSQQVRQIFARYDPAFCPMSLDEAYLNFTEHVLQRQGLSAAERSVLKRRQTPADPDFCCCDLNMTMRSSVFTEHDAEKVHSSASDHSQKRADINGSSDHNGHKADTSENDGPHRETENQNPKESTSENNTSSGPPVVRESSTCSTLQHADRHGSRPCPGAEQHGDGQGAPSSLCPSCGKALPPFEIVTFGLDVESAVHEMRCRIEQRTCLTASAGIAPNMMLSKVCSDQNKPNGQFFLPPRSEDIQQFVQKLPIRKVSGIGRVSEQLLGALGISTCSDLFEKRTLLYHLYSPVSFSHFMQVACGIGSTEVARASEEERKSMSTEQTFGELNQPEELYGKCLELCQLLAEDLTKEQLKGKTISLKTKTTDFQVRTRAQTISNYSSDADVIFSVAKGILRSEILAESPKPLRLRLMGVRMSKLVAESDCPQEKQNTILGFFKKTSVSCNEQSATDLHRPGSYSSTIHNFCATETFDNPDFRTSGITVSEGNQPSGATSTNSAKKRVSFADGTSDCVLGDEGHTSAISEASAVPNFSRGKGDNQTPRPSLQEVREQMESSSAATNRAGPAVSEEKVCEAKHERCEVNAGNGSVRTDQEGDCTEVPHALNGNFNDCASQNSTSAPSASSVVDTPGPSLDTPGPSLDTPGPSLDTPGPSLDTPDPNLDTLGPSLHHSAQVNFPSPSPYGYDLEGELRGSSNDDVQGYSVIHAPFSVTEPFTCPVCCRPVGCINLTDFNAHIDRCLQPQSQLAVRSPNSSSKTSSTSKVSFAPTTPSQKSKSSRISSNKCSPGVKFSADSKKQRDGTSSKTAAGNTNSGDAGVSHPRLPSIMDESIPGSGSAGLEKRADPATSQCQTQHENCAGSEPDSLDFMMCPLCGAERADWTLDTFNQHVDTCLNRDTIAQMLREQQTSEEPPRKRLASSQEEHRSAQQGKKAKKSQSSGTERSILSFFKR